MSWISLIPRRRSPIRRQHSSTVASGRQRSPTVASGRQRSLIPRRTRRKIDKPYLDFIRSLCCVVCQIRQCIEWSSRTEAAHVGVRGLGQKCSDRETIPLCPAHHRLDRDSCHRLGKRFWQHHGLDREALIAAFNQRYEREAA
jgi:hypothetical protein